MLCAYILFYIFYAYLKGKTDTYLNMAEPSSEQGTAAGVPQKNDILCKLWILLSYTWSLLKNTE